MKTSIYPERGRSEWIVSERPPRKELNPDQPHSFFIEQERMDSGEIEDSAAIFLTGKECPWRCLMCDLWKNTLKQRTPPGTIPRQIDYALSRLGGQPRQIKLYNSGNFFDHEAVPLEDYPAIARRLAGTTNVVVESHPRLVGGKTLRLRDMLGPVNLEMAMGLETIHPEVLPRLNKGLTCAHFSAAAEFLRKEKVAMRAFVLVRPPFLGEEESLEWTVKTARFAFDCGASIASLIPTRPGNGAMDRLMDTGEFTPPSLGAIERALAAVLNLGLGRAFADTWDLGVFSRCSACLAKRTERLARMNLFQQYFPQVECGACGGI
jgi:radical SAM enzyme (TIGR01210 family)